MMVLVTRCAANPIVDLRQFEDELLAQAAANAHCKRVRFVRVNERDNPDKTALPILQKPHWRLNIDYQPGASTQHWWMTDSPSRATYPKGEGNPKEIAADICSIVIERGAKLLN